MTRKRLAMAAVLTAMLVGYLTGAQDPKAALQDRLAAIKEAMAKNQASLRQYTWRAHTEVSVRGEVKNQKDELCQYGPMARCEDAVGRGAATAASAGHEGQDHRKEEG